MESAGGDLRGDDLKDRRLSKAITSPNPVDFLFYDVTELSKLRIPSVSVVFGSSTAGGAYQPGMSDYNIRSEPVKKLLVDPP